MENESNVKHASFYGEKGLQSLEIVLVDLFVAGSDTTSLTLNWTILYLLHYPGVQAKVHAELDRVVGRSRFYFIYHYYFSNMQEVENCTICLCTFA